MKLLLLVALAAHAAGLRAQILAPGRRIEADSIAYVQLSDVARKAMTSRVEQMVCVTASAVIGDTLIIGRVEPARNVVQADSIHMEFRGPVAEWWQPCIHTHFLDWPLRDYPSPDDEHSAAIRGIYGLLMIVKPDTSWILKPYP